MVSATTAKLTGIRDRTGGRAEGDPADAARRDQPTAFGRRERFQHRRAGGATAPGRDLPARAEQRGRRGLQRRGELAQRGRAGPGRVPLQVLQVAQAHPGAGGHLGLARAAARRGAARLACSGHQGQAATARPVLLTGSPFSGPLVPCLDMYLTVIGIAASPDPVAAGPRTPLHLLGSLRLCAMPGRRPAHRQPRQAGAWWRVALATSGRDVGPPRSVDRDLQRATVRGSRSRVTFGTGRRSASGDPGSSLA